MEYKRLSEIASYSDKRTTDVLSETYISTENMLPDRGGVSVAEKVPICKSASKYEVGDILISNIRPYFKKIWFADREGSCSNDVLVIKAKKEIDASFLYYVLSDDNFFNYDTVNSKGTKMPRGNKAAIMKYLVPLPSLPLQRRIAAVLSSYDRLIELNRERIKILERISEQLYREWFIRHRFPQQFQQQEWKEVRLGEVVKRLPFNRLYKADELVRQGNIIVIDQSTNPYLGFHNSEPSHYASLEKPIILFGDHSCKFQLMTVNFSLAENVIPFIGNDANILDNYYLFYAVKRLITTEEYKRHWGRLVAMKILVPPIALQSAFDDQVKPMFREIELLTQQNANLARQRDLLLPRLLTGKIEPPIHRAL